MINQKKEFRGRDDFYICLLFTFLKRLLRTNYNLTVSLTIFICFETVECKWYSAHSAHDNCTSWKLYSSSVLQILLWYLKSMLFPILEELIELKYVVFEQCSGYTYLWHAIFTYYFIQVSLLVNLTLNVIKCIFQMSSAMLFHFSLKIFSLSLLINLVLHKLIRNFH